MASGLFGWVAKDSLQGRHSRKVIKLLPVLAFSIPTIQFFLFQQSSRLGPLVGPVITELLTYYPLVAISAFAGAIAPEDVNLSQWGMVMVDQGLFAGSVWLFVVIEQAVTKALSEYIGSRLFTTRIGLQFVAAALYAVSLPSKWLLLTIPSILFCVLFNVHVPLAHTTALLNSTLQTHNYIILDRQESLTGYLSVLENVQDNFRVLRCDHSLLGGEWTQIPNRHNPMVKEPVYVIFTMLEAVRLIEKDDDVLRRADSDSNALVMYGLPLLTIL